MKEKCQLCGEPKKKFCTRCGSSVPNKSQGEIIIPVELDTTKLDIALAKAEKLKAILSEVQGHIATATINIQIKIEDHNSDPLDELKRKIIAAIKNGDVGIKIQLGD